MKYNGKMYYCQVPKKTTEYTRFFTYNPLENHFPKKPRVSNFVAPITITI